jgi:hypothetical protein
MLGAGHGEGLRAGRAGSLTGLIEGCLNVARPWGMPWLGMGGGGGSCVPLAILPSTGQAGRAG